jgi:hypothetical protein
MEMDIVAEVQAASGRLELALVLDVTGSMNCVSAVTTACAQDWQTPDNNSRIKGLKTAAKSLIDYLMKDSILTSDDHGEHGLHVQPVDVAGLADASRVDQLDRQHLDREI